MTPRGVIATTLLLSTSPLTTHYAWLLAACVPLLRIVYLYCRKNPADLRQKRATIALASRTKEPNHSLHEDSTFGSPNNKGILNQFVLRLSFCKATQYKVRLQINGLTTNETVNDKKVYSYSTKPIRNDAYSGPA